jgi:tetratricopeptide (TPR) repeat protein
VGLPARIAIPILVVFAAIFLGILGWLLRIGFGTTGSAFGPSGAPAQHGDARIAATPAPLATDPPGTFTVPQTGTGPARDANALPGASTGGGNAAGPPAPVMQQLAELRARLARDPKDREALVQLGDMEYAAQKFDKAKEYYHRALVLAPGDAGIKARFTAAQRQLAK